MTDRNHLIDQFLEVLVRFKRYLDQSVAVEDRVGTLLQFYALRFLSKNPQATVGELAETLNMSSSAVSQLTDRLVEAKLIKRESDRYDRRVVRLSATTRGKTQVFIFSKLATKKGNELFAKLSDEDLQTIIRIYNKFLSE